MGHPTTPDPAARDKIFVEQEASANHEDRDRISPSAEARRAGTMGGAKPALAIKHYLLAVVSVLLAIIVTLRIELLGTKTPFALFFAAVVITSWYGGRYPGLLAIGLSTCLTARFLIAPYSVIPDINGAMQLSVFVLVALVINWLTTARIESERSRLRSEERYRLLFESNPMPMWVYDRESLRFLEVNDAAVRQYGYTREEFLGMKIVDIRPPEDVASLIDVISQPPSPFGDTQVWRHKKKDGTVFYVDVTAHSINLNDRPARLVLANDVTERRTLEHQLQQSQKLEAIGLLAGGVAHDFNNLLTAILGHGELALLHLRSDDPVRTYVEQITKAGEQAASLTRQLLAFGRKQILQPKVIDVNAIVAETEKMLRRVIGENIAFRTVLHPHLGKVKADPGQVGQILMNLVVNARDAMPRGGKLTIETDNIYLDEDYAKMHIAVVPGRYVMMAVSDTGAGMDEETQSRIFEPFFTTKKAGEGTGLGLSTIYGIVKQSGGNIWVYSEPGKGTAFKIYLPLVDQEPPGSEVAMKVEVVSNGHETILLAEDEEIVRDLAREILMHYGYRVLEAASGKDALSICKNFDGRIDLLVTDVIMPEMSGRDLADNVGQLYPGIKVLYMSGYADGAVVHQGELEEGANFIQKPFTMDGLARKVRDVLHLA